MAHACHARAGRATLGWVRPRGADARSVYAEEVVWVTPFSDVRVHDLVVFDEIELYGELIIAASQSDGPLTQAEIDAVLGIGTAPHGNRGAPWSEQPGGGRSHE